MRPTNEELNCLIHNTTEDRLLCLNDVKARLYLPVTVFLGLLIVVGTIGNATVCLVYSRRKSRVSSHYFILYLAALDLLTCVVGMPTEIADLVLPYTFESPWACKVLRFTHSSTIIASSTILIQVAFDRYYRICQLGRQFTANKARLLCVGAVLLGFLCSWPTFLLFGRKTVTRNLDGVILTGTDCSTDDSMRRTIYPTIYYIFLFSLFGITVTFFAVLYSKIGLTILRRKKFSSSSVTSSPRPPRGLRRSGSRRTPARELPSSDVSSDQDNGHGNSTASGNSNSSNNSNMSTATSTTTVSTIFPGNLRRFWTRKKRQSHHHRSSTPVVPSADSLHNSTRSKRSVTRSVENIAQGNDDNDDSNNNHCNTATTTTNNSIDSINNLNESNINNLARMIYASYGASANVVTANGEQENDNDVNEALPECNDEDGDNENSVEHKTYGFSIAAKTRIYTKNGQPRFSQPNNQHQHHQQHYINTDDDDDNDNGAAQTKGHNSKKQTHQRSSQRQIRVGKTTTVLFAVTLAYILSFFPYLTVMVMRSIIKDLEENLSPVGELAYKLCVKSFFINNAINPLIYSFLNQAFRQDAKQMLKRACCRSNNVPGRPHPNPI